MSMAPSFSEYGPNTFSAVTPPAGVGFGDKDVMIGTELIAKGTVVEVLLSETLKIATVAFPAVANCAAGIVTFIAVADTLVGVN